MTRATVSLWAALFLWGMHGPIGRALALGGVPVLGVMAARLWIGALVFGGFLWATGRFDRGLLGAPGAGRRLSTLAVVGVFLNTLVFHLGIPYIPATLVMLLENLAPVFVLLLTWWFDGRRPGGLEAGAMVLAAAGLGLIVRGRAGESAVVGEPSLFYLGVAFELAAGLTWGAYIWLSARWVRGLSFDGVVTLLFLSFGISALLSTPALLTFRGVALTGAQLGMILVLGVLQSGIAYLLWNFALTRIAAGPASIAFYMTVVFTGLNETLFMDLRLTWPLVVGGSLILAGVLSLQWPRRGNTPRSLP